MKKNAGFDLQQGAIKYQSVVSNGNLDGWLESQTVLAKSICSEVFRKLSFLKSFGKLPGKHLGCVISVKLQDLRTRELTAPSRIFFILKIVKIFETTFLWNILEELCLTSDC